VASTSSRDLVRARELTYAEARGRVLRAAKPLPPVAMPVARCAGRPLREDVVAPHDLPRFDNSAMDGFAVRADDLARATATRPVVLHVTEIVPAGHTASLPLEPGKAIRLMTGAMIPPGADTIVPFEDCEPIERNGVERVRFRSKPSAGQHVRSAGADARAGERLLGRGRELSPFDLGLLAGVGAANVRVGPRPRAAILSTGD
jgi:molybdopterin molybdotransferase